MAHDINYSNEVVNVKEEQLSPQQDVPTNQSCYPLQQYDPSVVSSPSAYIPPTHIPLYPTGATALVPAPPCYEVIQNRIFVGGYPQATTESDLREHFEKFYPVKDVKMIKSLDGTSKGYGFVTFETEDQAEAIRQLDPKKLEFRNRNLNLGPALKKLGTSLYTSGYNLGTTQVITPSQLIPASPSAYGYAVTQVPPIFVFPQTAVDGQVSPSSASPSSQNQFFMPNETSTPAKSYASAVSGRPTPLMSAETVKPLEDIGNGNQVMNNSNCPKNTGYYLPQNHVGYQAKYHPQDKENYQNSYNGQTAFCNTNDQSNVERDRQYNPNNFNGGYYHQSYYYPQSPAYSPPYSAFSYPCSPGIYYPQNNFGYNRPMPPSLLSPGTFPNNYEGYNWNHSNSYGYGYTHNGGHNYDNMNDINHGNKGNGSKRHKNGRNSESKDEKSGKSAVASQKTSRSDKRSWKESVKSNQADSPQKGKSNSKNRTKSETLASEINDLSISNDENKHEIKT